MKNQKLNDTLIQAVIEQIEREFAVNDYSTVSYLLHWIPPNILNAYLPEDAITEPEQND